MKLYNTLTRKIEVFKPFDEKEVKLYTCGPTVYHYAHIGNLRTYIFEDVLERSLKYLGYPVKRVMNITDVGHLANDSDTGEDKMLAGAKREKKTVWEVAEYYTNAFFSDIEKLNIIKPEIISKATDNIEFYITIIEKLLADKYAYIAGGNVYFDTSKITDYYTLSGLDPDDLKVAVREDVNEDENKLNPSDFGLWFTSSKFDDQAMKWDSPWGVGYPGWHIECTGISIKYLGENIDIHCGGVDNIFPHHTNEIAQSEAYLGHKWCTYWLHGEHLMDKTGKMSKSNGEFLTLSLLESKGYNPLAYRYFSLMSHYRKQLVFTYENIDGAVNAYNKVLNKTKEIKNNIEGEINEEYFLKFNNNFKAALANDLNTSTAITVMHDVIKANINNKTKFELLSSFDEVLGLDLFKEEEIDGDLKIYVEKKIKERSKAKSNKDFALADSIRVELEKKGVILKDGRDGTTFEIK